MVGRRCARALVLALLVLGTVLALTASASASTNGDIFDSNASNTQIRPANDQTAAVPDFAGVPWQTPVAGFHPAYSILPGADWLGETTDFAGHPINQRWEQYRAVFDLPAGDTSAGVELLVDNEVTEMTINGVQFGCGYDQTCNYFNGDRFAISIPSSALQPTGNELLITVLDYESGLSTGGLTFKVVAPGLVANQAPSDASGFTGGAMSAQGSFRETIDSDASHPITITADNTFGTFTDNGDGTWSWTANPTDTGSGTITVSATDDRGLTATEQFNYTVSAGPTIALSGADCVTISDGLVQPFDVTVTNAPQDFFYVFAEASPEVPDTLNGLWAFGLSSGATDVTVDNLFQYVRDNPSSLWLTVRGSNYPTDLRASLEVPVCGSDTTPPTTTDNAPTAWQNTDTTVTLTASDGDGSGVATTYYSVDGGPQQTGTSVTIAAPGDHSDDGTHTITYHSVDNDGNAETPHSTTVRIDTTAPAASPTPETAANANGWYSADAIVDWNWSDASAGIDPSGCTTSTTSTGEGNELVVSATCTDLAGNTGSSTYTVNVDKTAPVVAYSGNAGTYDVDQTVAITCAASDTLSGVASTTCADIGGSAVSFGLGTHSYSASATDDAGNTGNGSTSFTVVVTYDGLCGLVKELVGNAGIANSLCVKLDAASAAASRGQTKTAANDIAAFDNEVAAQSGKAITAAQAGTLTGLAAHL
jgi:hypothetical protein